jgi:hypothetical protein
VVIPLDRIVRLEKGNQYSWIPGGGMIIEVFVQGLDRVHKRFFCCPPLRQLLFLRKVGGTGKLNGWFDRYFFCMSLIISMRGWRIHATFFTTLSVH